MKPLAGKEHNAIAMAYPLLISAAGVFVCLLTTLVATDLKPAKQISEIEHSLKMQLIISTVIMTPVSLKSNMIFKLCMCYFVWSNTA